MPVEGPAQTMCGGVSGEGSDKPERIMVDVGSPGTTGYHLMASSMPESQGGEVASLDSTPYLWTLGFILEEEREQYQCN